MTTSAARLPYYHTRQVRVRMSSGVHACVFWQFLLKSSGMRRTFLAQLSTDATRVDRLCKQHTRSTEARCCRLRISRSTICTECDTAVQQGRVCGRELGTPSPLDRMALNSMQLRNTLRFSATCYGGRSWRSLRRTAFAVNCAYCAIVSCISAPPMCSAVR